MVQQKAPQALEKQVISLARQLGLPSTFTDLKIEGLDKVASSRELSAKNKELIFRFLTHISPEVSERRLTFYTHKLRRLADWLKKDFDVVTEEDLRSLITFISKGNPRLNGGKFSQGTVHGYKVTLKRFYRWLEGNDEEYPRKVRWIKSNGDATRIKEPEQLLTFEEVLKMIRYARNPRDKAIVSFLYESGARLSELLSMKIKHLEFTSTVVKATLPVSKTQPRIIPLVSCKRHLSTWLNYHPLKDDPEAPLWSNMKRRGNDSLIGQTVSEILKAIASDAGINKRVYPHLFRACSITHKQGGGWPEQAIKMFHGLSKDSKVMKHYSHLSYNNLEQIQRKMNGLPVDNSSELNNGIKCPGCGKVSPLFADMCECGLPTEVKILPAGQGSLESDIEARLQKKMEEFLEKRLGYDRFMEWFMNSLLEKTKKSPALMKAISEIKMELQNQHPQNQSHGSCQN
ncbi:MAG: tyrosine-type recombinase/integrase [Sedimentisphaerales bacterium]